MSAYLLAYVRRVAPLTAAMVRAGVGPGTQPDNNVVQLEVVVEGRIHLLVLELRLSSKLPFTSFTNDETYPNAMWPIRRKCLLCARSTPPGNAMCPHAALLGGRKRQVRCEPGGPNLGVQIHASVLCSCLLFFHACSQKIARLAWSRAKPSWCWPTDSTR